MLIVEKEVFSVSILYLMVCVTLFFVVVVLSIVVGMVFEKKFFGPKKPLTEEEEIKRMHEEWEELIRPKARIPGYYIPGMTLEHFLDLIEFGFYWIIILYILGYIREKRKNKPNAFMRFVRWIVRCYLRVFVFFFGYYAGDGRHLVDESDEEIGE